MKWFFCQQDVVVSEWPKTPDANGELVRNLSYTLSLNLPMTSKKAPTTEKQVNARVFLEHANILDTSGDN